MIKCMKEADRKKCKSIAFPAIGAGSLGYPLHVVADQMFNTAHKWCDENSKSSIENITFVIYHTDEEALEAFKFAEKAYIQNNTKSPVKEPRATQISPRQAADSSTDVSNTSHGQVKTKTVSSIEQSSSLKHSLKLTHTTVMHVQNPESIGSAVQPDVEEMIILPTANTGCLMQFFNINLLQSLGKEGCDIFFNDDTVCVKGTEEITKMGKQKLKEAIEELSSLCVETISIPRRFEPMIINQEVNNIESDMDVYCNIDTLKKNVTFYGKTMNQVTEAKVRLERLFAAHQTTNTSQALQLEDEFENDTSMKRVSDKQKKPAESRSFWSWDAKKFITFVTSENIEIKVYSADILSSLPVDCIVNAANINLAHGGGVAKAIAKAGGKDLTQEGHDYLKSHGKLKVGEACYTKAGQLPYKLVIHAVGPCWSDYAPHSQV
ncbi:protein mono-ADP-ribosyltransferase PARP14-like [Mercenaria mercenaria]|uniref:protein mono-ADP-ribosyltransferase PARP14-like n=1 Tax=Mercenaria mercenaria TaxID=6596 RepID=UPI00234F23E2|nr:protein mono-ADP-ribosyltransferase PARP14-like [Mercenaria mercenaria]